MADRSLQTVVGIEIAEDLISLVQMRQTPEGPIVDKIKAVTIPPRVIHNGEIADAEILAEQLNKTVSEAGFNGTNVVVTLRDFKYLKGTERRVFANSEAIRASIEERVTGSYPFFNSNRQFEFGYQIPEAYQALTTGADLFRKPFSALYAAIEKSKIDRIRELMEAADLNLVAIDIVPLAILRAMMWSGNLGRDPIITVVVEEQYLDVAIVDQGTVMASRSIRRSFAKEQEEPVDTEEVFQEIQLMLTAYYNGHPKAPKVNGVMLFSRVKEGKRFLVALKKLFSDYNCQEYAPATHIKYDKKRLTDPKTPEMIEEVLPAIGLCLKYFEKYNATLSLIKVRKQVGPMINKVELGFAGALLAISLALFIFASFYFNAAVNKIDQDMYGIRDEMRALQTGESLAGQQKLMAIKSQINRYEVLENKIALKAPFFERFATGIPQDLSISDLSYNLDSIVLGGSAYMQASIFSFYNYLNQSYKKVLIDKIGVEYLNADKTRVKNHFTMQIQLEK